jgi:hypothetical protein
MKSIKNRRRNSLILVISIIILFSSNLYSQEKDKKDIIEFAGQKDSILNLFLNSKNDTLENFLNSKLVIYNNYIKKVDSIYEKFKAGKWKVYKTYPINKRYINEPIQEPVYKPGNRSAIEILPPRESKYESFYIIPENPIIPKVEPELENFINEAPLKKTISFYGRDETIYLDNEPIPRIDKLTGQSITEFIGKLDCNGKWKLTIDAIGLSSVEMKLNNWGLVLFLKYVAENIFVNRNSQALFIFFSLNRLNFTVKLGYSKNNIYLFLIPAEEVYTTPSMLVIGGKDPLSNKVYTFIDFLNIKEIDSNIYFHEDKLGTQKISFYMRELPILGEHIISKKVALLGDSISININLENINYFKDFPNVDPIVLFNTPISVVTLNSFDKYFLPYIKSMKPAEKVNFFLKFVQDIKYGSDIIEWRGENFFFPDETLFYSKSDCEDKAVLFARLIKNYTDLLIVGLKFPDHLATAININEELNYNDVFRFNTSGLNFVIGDAACVNAKIGQCDSSLFLLPYEIIDFDGIAIPYNNINLKNSR